MQVNFALTRSARIKHNLKSATTARSIRRMLYCAGVDRRAERCSNTMGLWIQVLDLLDRLMHVDRRDQLVRHAPDLVLALLLTVFIAVRGRAGVPEKRAARDERDWAAGTADFA